MQIQASQLVILALRKLYEADRANVYVNPRNLAFTIKARLPRYEGTYFRFEPLGDCDQTLGVLKAYGRADSGGAVVCDGASLAPDWPTGVLPGTALHDPGYLEMDAIAEAWKNEPYAPGPGFGRDWITRLTAGDSPTWTPADVRQLMDAIFGDTLRKAKARRYIVRLYYSAVRLLGPLGHRRRGTAGALLAMALGLSMSGCAGGCMSPPDIIEFPDGPPEIERVAGGDLGDAVRGMILETFRTP